jgi:hypothetical protein
MKVTGRGSWAFSLRDVAGELVVCGVAPGLADPAGLLGPIHFGVFPHPRLEEHGQQYGPAIGGVVSYSFDNLGL